jgi:hypothetical protein
MKTKARAARTVNTDCDMGCDCVMNIGVAVDVVVWEGDKYKVDGGTGAAAIVE